MGHHYIPQKYLQGFADPIKPGYIWQYDKQKKIFLDQSVSIKDVAQKRNYYDSDTETALNDLVERPANAVLDKLRSFNFNLTSNERFALSVYVATMWKRVPQYRIRGAHAIPQVVTDVVLELREKVNELVKKGQVDDSSLAQIMSNIDAVEEEYQKKLPDHVRKKLDDQLRAPWPSKAIVDVIFKMQWRFVCVESSSFILTSDNPLFYWDQYGVGTDKSELIFPIAYNLALYGNWTSADNKKYEVNVDQSLVHKINKRIASKATRFVYSSEKADWIAKIANRQNPRLGRMYLK